MHSPTDVPYIPGAPMRPQRPLYEPPWHDPTAEPWRPSLNMKFAFAVTVGIVIGVAFNWVAW